MGMLGRQSAPVPLTDDDIVHGTGGTKIAAGTTAQRPVSPTTDMIRKNTEERCFEHYDPVSGQWIQMGKSFEATGGTVTTSGAYTIHTFTTSGTFTVLSGSADIEYMVLAGGGSGGCCGNGGGGGGGGAGGFLEGTMSGVSSNLAVTIGAGGAPYNNGGNSSLGAVTATGGGRGGTSSGASGVSGGSGGGGNPVSGSYGSGIAGQGYRGGYVGSLNQGDNGAAGGGGAGGAGSDCTWSNTGSGGGAMRTATINGVAYGAGGAGGNGTVWNNGNGTSAGANTGSGGRGAGPGYTGGSGGSGIVLIRYLTP